MRAAAILLLTSLPALAQTIAVPSGQPVEFVDLVRNAPGTAETVWRFRFLAPQITREGGSVSAVAAAADIDALCADYVQPVLARYGVAPDQVIISLSDRPVAFGAPAPGATQYFEAYRIEGGTCVWEAY